MHIMCKTNTTTIIEKMFLPSLLPALHLKIPPVKNCYVTYTLISSADTPHVAFC
jgi:hypothetical protein